MRESVSDSYYIVREKYPLSSPSPPRSASMGDNIGRMVITTADQHREVAGWRNQLEQVAALPDAALYVQQCDSPLIR